MGMIVRAAIVLFGVFEMVGGLAAVAGGHLEGFLTMAFGAVLVIVPVIERGRYRSEATDRTLTPTGPGGGETADAPVEARFRSTTETFVDPTTGHVMRVLIDPRTGERRYVAEG